VTLGQSFELFSKVKSDTPVEDVNDFGLACRQHTGMGIAVKRRTPGITESGRRADLLPDETSIPAEPALPPRGGLFLHRE